MIFLLSTYKYSSSRLMAIRAQPCWERPHRWRWCSTAHIHFPLPISDELIARTSALFKL